MAQLSRPGPIRTVEPIAKPRMERPQMNHRKPLCATSVEGTFAPVTDSPFKNLEVPRGPARRFVRKQAETAKVRAPADLHAGLPKVTARESRPLFNRCRSTRGPPKISRSIHHVAPNQVRRASSPGQSTQARFSASRSMKRFRSSSDMIKWPRGEVVSCRGPSSTTEDPRQASSPDGGRPAPGQFFQGPLTQDRLIATPFHQL